MLSDAGVLDKPGLLPAEIIEDLVEPGKRTEFTQHGLHGVVVFLLPPLELGAQPGNLFHGLPNRLGLGRIRLGLGLGRKPSFGQEHAFGNQNVVQLLFKPGFHIHIYYMGD